MPLAARTPPPRTAGRCSGRNRLAAGHALVAARELRMDAGCGRSDTTPSR
jgi:hypothetical protein